MPRYTSSSPSISPTSRTYASSNSHRSSVSSDSGPPRQHRPVPAHSDSGKDILKTSLVFLGVIGAASIAASRYWPKGVLYGEKETWTHDAKEAKEEVKHIMKGDRSHRRRPRDIGHGDQDAFRRRRPPHVTVRDEPVAPGPADRNIYVGPAPSPARKSEDDRRNRSRQRVLDPQERRRFSDEPLRSQEFKGSPSVE
ncbi:uncharacterized protein GGS22DRAFT_174107 [Annulohypoxylon maeteangense]|uniref:uncharacterized protein n=1 Tax=Annulohypoxylon maeteangense TaxID=1927788 RepID=UPI002008D2D8|nr:uncharacterized protein GGS22DRAFT_174107 [Annulohypoxylon maeteangense]KAI0880741.1 hypothetical protein GGS22DRAFT_174107 [Annulohypoxylon maeteangense]